MTRTLTVRSFPRDKTLVIFSRSSFISIMENSCEMGIPPSGNQSDQELKEKLQNSKVKEVPSESLTPPSVPDLQQAQPHSSLHCFSKLFDNLLTNSDKINYALVQQSQFSKLDLSEQLDLFIKSVTLSDKEYQIRHQLIQDLHSILKIDFPNCKLYPFGSFITRVADSTSDVDAYLDLGDPKITKADRLSKAYAILKASRCAQTGLPLFKQIVPLRNARIPILKLEHSITGVKCDLSFENLIAVQNTKLLQFYFNFNPNILPLMKLIRYWARYHDLVGSNKIKNYALALMVIVFLIELKIVPSVGLLQYLKAKKRVESSWTPNPAKIDGWDTSFSDNANDILSVFQPQSFLEEKLDATPSKTVLLMAYQFFRRYSQLDLSTVIISPFFGRVIPKPEFHKLKQNLNSNNAALSIQDPFILNFNVGHVSKAKTVIKFQIACASTAKMFERANSNIATLLDLFILLPRAYLESRVFKKAVKDPAIVIPQLEAIKDIKSVLNLATSSTSAPGSRQNISFPRHLEKLGHLLKEDIFPYSASSLKLAPDFQTLFVKKIKANHRQEMSENISLIWGDFVLDFIIEFFTSGLQLNVFETNREEKLYEGSPAWKLQNENKVIDGADQPDYISDKFSPNFRRGIFYQKHELHINYPFWNKRKGLKKSLKFNNTIEYEKQLSEMIYEEFLKKRKHKFEPFIINVLTRLDLSLEDGPPHIFIAFESLPNYPKGSKQATETASRAFQKLLPNYVGTRLENYVSVSAPLVDMPMNGHHKTHYYKGSKRNIMKMAFHLLSKIDPDIFN